MNSILAVVFSIVVDLLQIEAVQTGLIVLVIAIVGLLIKRWSWVRHIVNLGIQAYEYAEYEGALNGWKGYEKFAPFMSRFIAGYREKYGTSPPPQAKALAVKAMEQKVLLEHQPAGN
jgi:hypothetical protein